MNDKSKNNPEIDNSENIDSLKSEVKGVSRRSVTKAGAAAPLLLSFLGRPVWGDGCTISAMGSANTSGRNPIDCEARGCSKEYWKSNIAAWDNIPYSPGVCALSDGANCLEWNTEGGTTFQSVFGFPPGSGEFSNPETITLLGILLESELKGYVNNYYAELVTSLLNSGHEYYGADEEQIVSLAKAVYSNLPYEGQMVDEATANDWLSRMNSQGDCFLLSVGTAEPGYVIAEQKPIPCCRIGEQFDMVTGQCINVDDWQDGVNLRLDEAGS
ncbi:hypothetical protein G8770_03995 [Aestuariicella hydrocarbonica]|uniref:Uncharacterized protein n=1 Tax=Pseudomaricurvus hydrocarbonicus TaxID=1470433 RepID=A0A9E5JUD0_9GAMM|nr:hypothetical protein [Aestuariicella hydrocarbonica]NHO64706.1 hypothetical protein [Aestuariicella hydrocarbonica]